MAGELRRQQGKRGDSGGSEGMAREVRRQRGRHKDGKGGAGTTRRQPGRQGDGQGGEGEPVMARRQRHGKCGQVIGDVTCGLRHDVTACVGSSMT